MMQIDVALSLCVVEKKAVFMRFFSFNGELVQN
jgi:hypothetical protein